MIGLNCGGRVDDTRGYFKGEDTSRGRKMGEYTWAKEKMGRVLLREGKNGGGVYLGEEKNGGSTPLRVFLAPSLTSALANKF